MGGWYKHLSKAVCSSCFRSLFHHVEVCVLKELAKSVAHGAHDQVKRLLEQRASVDGDLGLAGAVRSNFFAVAGLLLDARADANIPDDEGVSALVRAATRCRPEGAEMVKQLLTCGALLEPNAESEPTKETSTGSFVTDRASFKVADLLVYLLRGEGSAFTNIVEVLLEEVGGHALLELEKTAVVLVVAVAGADAGAVAVAVAAVS